MYYIEVSTTVNERGHMKKYSTSVPFLFAYSSLMALPSSDSLHSISQGEPSVSLLFIVTVTSLSILLIAGIGLYISKKRHQKKLACRSALHVSAFPEECTSVVDNKKVPLKKILKSLDTLLYTTESVLMLRKRVSNYMPDLLIVDFRISKNIASTIEKIFVNYRLSSATTILFYNCPDGESLKNDYNFNESDVHVIPHVPTADILHKLCKPEPEVKNDNKEYLSGVIHDNSLPDMLQFLGSSSKTGCLVVEDENPLGVIFVNNGVIISAILRNGTKGIAAIYTLLNCKSGSFYFKLNKHPKEQELHLPVMAALMQWSTEKDEYIHETGQYPSIS